MAQPGWEDVAEYLRQSARRPEERKVGIEIERIGMWEDGQALNYRPQKSRDGIERPGAEQILRELQAKYGWAAVTSSDGRPLGFNGTFGKVSLEPGSQLELSTEAAGDLNSLAHAVKLFEDQVDAVTGKYGLHWIGLGVNPTSHVDDIDVIPSVRYHIMTDYLGRRARLGTSMMRLTSSVQINLDYTSEAEGIEMLRAALAAAPISYALFANSPFSQGKESGSLSYRSLIWKETDPDRIGLLPEVFRPQFSFSDYARLGWQRPLMFAQDTSGAYIAANGCSAADIQAGKLTGAIIDENNRLNPLRQLFTEARIKPGYVEVRSLDGLRPADRYAAVAFWLGLLYSGEARRLVLQHCSAATSENREALWDAAIRDGLDAKVSGCSVRSLAAQLLDVARQSLRSRGYGEEKFLDRALAILDSNRNPAQQLLAQFHGAWQRDFAPVIRHCGQAV